MDSKKFKMLDEEFTCLVCGAAVTPLKYTARDHCPSCLSSIHVDINPGDRACICKGILNPIGIDKGKKENLKIVYKCEKCGMIKRNIMAKDDDFDKILEVMTKSIDTN